MLRDHVHPPADRVVEVGLDPAQVVPRQRSLAAARGGPAAKVDPTGRAVRPSEVLAARLVVQGHRTRPRAMQRLETRIVTKLDRPLPARRRGEESRGGARRLSSRSPKAIPAGSHRGVGRRIGRPPRRRVARNRPGVARSRQIRNGWTRPTVTLVARRSGFSTRFAARRMGRFVGEATAKVPRAYNVARQRVTTAGETTHTQRRRHPTRHGTISNGRLARSGPRVWSDA